MPGKIKKTLSEKRSANLAGAIQNWNAGVTRVSHFPLALYLEPTSACNLACPMCPVAMGVRDYQYEEKFLDLSLVEAMAEPLSYALRCFMSGGGEPFLHPYFISLLELVRSYEPEIIFNTNGTLITPEIALHLVKLSINTISFSIDATSPEKYRAIRKGAELSQALEGIILIQDQKRKLGVDKPYLNMQFTLMKENRDELFGLVQFAYTLGINHLVIEPLSPIFSFDPAYQEFFQNNYVPCDEDLLKTLKKLAGQAKGRMVFSSHYLEELTAPPRCAQPWINFGVRTDGRVFLCCGTPDKMGSLKESDFSSIWNGPVYQKFRSEIVAGRYPAACSRCLAEARSPWFNLDLMGQ